MPGAEVRRLCIPDMSVRLTLWGESESDVVTMSLPCVLTLTNFLCSDSELSREAFHCDLAPHRPTFKDSFWNNCISDCKFINFQPKL